MAEARHKVDQGIYSAEASHLKSALDLYERSLQEGDYFHHLDLKESLVYKIFLCRRYLEGIQECLDGTKTSLLACATPMDLAGTRYRVLRLQDRLSLSIRRLTANLPAELACLANKLKAWLASSPPETHSVSKRETQSQSQKADNIHASGRSKPQKPSAVVKPGDMPDGTTPAPIIQCQDKTTAQRQRDTLPQEIVPQATSNDGSQTVKQYRHPRLPQPDSISPIESRASSIYD